MKRNALKVSLFITLFGTLAVSLLVYNQSRQRLDIEVRWVSDHVASVTARNLHRNFVQGHVYVDTKTEAGWARVPGPSMIISVEAGGASLVPVDVPDSDAWRVRVGYVERETLRQQVLLKHGARLHRLKLGWLRPMIQAGTEKESHEQIGPEMQRRSE
jgi:hypothetical protein